MIIPAAESSIISQALTKALYFATKGGATGDEAALIKRALEIVGASVVPDQVGYDAAMSGLTANWIERQGERDNRYMDRSVTEMKKWGTN